MARERNTELTIKQKAVILQLRALGWGWTAIGKAPLVNLPESSVRSAFNRMLSRSPDGTIPNAPMVNASRSGRPEVLKPREKAKIIKSAKDKPFQHLNTLRAACAPRVSVTTIKRVLITDATLKKCRAAEKPLITPATAAARLAWALQHARWTAQDWKRVVWSDECTVTRYDDVTGHWVFRTPYQKYDKDKIWGTKKSGNTSLMVWGAFAGEFACPLFPHREAGGINRWRYIECLEARLEHFINEIQTALGVDPIFMQDNAPIHTSHAVQEWLADSGYEVMEWPPYSPDLNPIEHLWIRLKGRFMKKYPEIATMRGNTDTIKDFLAAKLPEIWQEVEAQEMWDLVQSMPRRVQAVIGASGYYTKY